MLRFSCAMSGRTSPKTRSRPNAGPSLAELQAENAKLRALLAEASASLQPWGRSESSDMGSNVKTFVLVESAESESKCGEGAQLQKRAVSPDFARRLAAAAHELAPERAPTPSKLASRPTKEVIKYYAEDIRPKTPQEKALEKQEHAVREAQWQGRQEGMYKPTPVLDKQSLTLRKSYSHDVTNEALEDPDLLEKEQAYSQAHLALQIITAPVGSSLGDASLYAESGEASPKRHSSSPARDSALEGIKFVPVSGQNVQIVDRKTVPTLQTIPSDYIVQGQEVDPSKQPLPLTLNQVEVRTAMVTGLRPFLPGAMDLDEELRRQRVDLQWESEDGKPSRPVSRARSPIDRPASSGPTIDYTPLMLNTMQFEHTRVGSRGDARAEARMRLTKNLDSLPSTSFLPHIPNAFDHSLEHKQWNANSGLNVIAGGDDGLVTGVLGVGSIPQAALDTSTTDSNFVGNGPQNAWTTGFKIITGATLDNATPPAPISVPTNSKGVALELVPVHSEFMRGILNYGKDAQAAYEAGASSSHYTAPQHPLLLTLLVSAKPLWKTAATQQFDPNLFLTLFPPPPEKIVLSVLDVVSMYSGMGVLHEGRNVINNSAATININVREWTTFLYELVNRYNDAYVAAPGTEGSVIPHVSRVFEPSSLEWWRRYARYVIVVRSKPNGQMLAKISKKLIDRLVQTLLINNSAPNVGVSSLYDGVCGSGAGTNTHNFPDAPHQDRNSLRINEQLSIHSWDFSHVQPLDATAVIHQVGWGNLNTSTVADTNTNASEKEVKAQPVESTEEAMVVSKEKDVTFTADMQCVPDNAMKTQTLTEAQPESNAIPHLDPESNNNVVLIRLNGAGVTYEDQSYTLPPQATMENPVKKRKPKKKTIVNAIPDELLERNARFEIQHMMNFSSDDRSVGSSASGISSKHALNQQVHKEKRPVHGPGSASEMSLVLSSSAAATTNATNDRMNEQAYSSDDVNGSGLRRSREHALANNKIRSLTAAPVSALEPETLIHAHHDVSVATRMNSPKSVYRVVPGRSRSPGYYGNENQKGKEHEFVGGYWNDNTDVAHDKPPTLRSTTGGNPAHKIEPRPELFVDEEAERKRKKKAKEAKAAQDSADEKEGRKSPKRVYHSAEEIARKTIIKAREVVSTNTKFRTRQLTEVEAGLFRSPFAVPLITEKMRREADML